jgi:hypothetical protein
MERTGMAELTTGNKIVRPTEMLYYVSMQAVLTFEVVSGLMDPGDAAPAEKVKHPRLSVFKRSIQLQSIRQFDFVAGFGCP